ncbi:MAG: PEP-utilizing enzyme [Patescibacteria group bacterium]|nr:PEP-utilizing enzyme [Patescibacteria group bacterium]
MRINKEKIMKLDWYSQGSAAKLLYASYPWRACTLMSVMGREMPFKYETLVYFKNHYFEVYFSKRSLKKISDYYFNKQNKNERFLKKLIDYWHVECVKPYKRALNQLRRDDLGRCSNQELLIQFRVFTKAYMKVWHEAVFLDSFDCCGDDILSDALAKENKKINPRDLEIILTPPNPSFLQKERIALLKIAESVIKRGGIIKNEKRVNRELAKHSRNFYWLHNDYATTEYLDAQYFKKELEVLLKNKAKIKKEKATAKFLDKLVYLRREIYQRYKFTEHFYSTVNFLSRLGNFRDERKAYNQMASNVLQKFAKEFSRRTRLTVEEVERLFHWEIEKIFRLTPKFIKNIKNRRQPVFYYLKDLDNFIEFYGETGRNLNNYLKNKIKENAKLTGRSAYPGIVKGTVRIVRDKRDFHKMKPGNILVAPNTRPEYSPIMKIAAAVVADEGGLTCHTAIVAREFKIPTVVGVQGAVNILKDGDRVEVDAKQGIVKKI